MEEGESSIAFWRFEAVGGIGNQPRHPEHNWRDFQKLSGIDLIHRYSGGVPRLINTLCDTALLCAFADEKPFVEEADVMSALNELNWEEHNTDTGINRKLQQVERRPPTGTPR